MIEDRPKAGRKPVQIDLLELEKLCGLQEESMHFDVIPPNLKARLNSARARARGTMLAAQSGADELRSQAREEASQCQSQRIGLEILQDRFSQAEAYLQEMYETAVVEFFAALISIWLQADANPEGVARELERGLPVPICDELQAIIILTPATRAKLEIARQELLEELWKQAECRQSVSAPTQKVRRGQGFAADTADHAKVAAAARRFGEDWRSHLAEICEELDHVEAKVPEGFRKNDYHESWLDVADALRAGDKSLRRKLLGHVRYRMNMDAKV